MNTAEDLLYQAYGLRDNDPAKLAMLEEAVQLADATSDTETGYEARDELIDAAVFGGHGERAITAFAWMLNAFDAAPEEYSTHNLYWKYKWILNTVRQFPQITAERVEGLMTDFERRLETSGYSPRPVLDARVAWARHRGDLEGAARQFGAWKRSKRDGMSDCSLCEADSEVHHLLFVGETDEALRRANLIFDGGRRCASVPHATHATVLEPLFRAGKLEAALHHHRVGYPMVKLNADFLGNVGEHLAFLGLTRNFRQARGVYAKHVSIALEIKELLEQFDFHAGALVWLLCERRAGKTTVNLSLPLSHPLHGETRLEAFVAFTNAHLEDLAARFDARNGTKSFAHRLEARRGLPERMMSEALKISG